LEGTLVDTLFNKAIVLRLLKKYPDAVSCYQIARGFTLYEEMKA